MGQGENERPGGPDGDRGDCRGSGTPRRSRSGPWAEGQVVAGRYVVERLLGAGAMGVVYLVFDRLLRKQVALKVLRADLARNRGTVRRFLREVALAQVVTHPNVVRIYDTGEFEGLPYFSMEYLKGQQLDRVIREARTDPQAALSIREIREIGWDVLQAVAAAHAAGVIHRDLKPSNVMLTHRGAIVMDFGVAGIDDSDDVTGRRMGIRFESLVRTEAGTIFGSPAYMAPELWEGAPASVQTDIYAFGVMLYQMLTGRLPYDAPTPAAFMEKLRTETPPRVRSLRKDTPWTMAVLVRRCMSHDPERRPPSAQAAARMISPLRARTRRQWLAAGLGAAALLSAAYVLVHRPPYRDEGVVTATDHADLVAAARAFDAGDLPGAAAHARRLAARRPRSAALRFLYATVLAEAGDESGRRRLCAEPSAADGNRVYRRMAQAACADLYSPGPPVLTLLDGGAGATDEAFLPLAVRFSLVDRLEGAGPATRNRVLALSNRVLSRMETRPDWDGFFLAPVLWEEARVHLLVARGEVDRALTLVSAVAPRAPETPRIQATWFWLAHLTGSRARARELADALREVDPRPHVRLLLERGRLRAAWSAVREAPPIFRSALKEMWCGYAFRFEYESAPVNCRDLPAGMVRALWRLGSTARAARNLSPHESTILSRQVSLDRGECRPAHDEQMPLLTHATPPFELYAAQLEVAHALCAHAPERADLAHARRVIDALHELAPRDPWVALLRSRIDDAAGEHDRAEATRRAVFKRWREADPDLPLVRRLRVSVGESPPLRIPSPRASAPPRPASAASPSGAASSDGRTRPAAADAATPP